MGLIGIKSAIAIAIKIDNLVCIAGERFISKGELKHMIVFDYLCLILFIVVLWFVVVFLSRYVVATICVARYLELGYELSEEQKEKLRGRKFKLPFLFK